MLRVALRVRPPERPKAPCRRHAATAPDREARRSHESSWGQSSLRSWSLDFAIGQSGDWAIEIEGPRPGFLNRPITELPNDSISLRVEPMQHPRERNRFPYMFQPAYPGHGPFYAHTEAAVRHAAVFAQVEIPLERFLRQSVLM